MPILECDSAGQRVCFENLASTLLAYSPPTLTCKPFPANGAQACKSLPGSLVYLHMNMIMQIFYTIKEMYLVVHIF